MLTVEALFDKKFSRLERRGSSEKDSSFKERIARKLFLVSREEHAFFTKALSFSIINRDFSSLSSYVFAKDWQSC